MKNKFKLIWIVIFLSFSNNLISYEIIRDPIFEDYFYNLSKELKINNIDVYLVKDKSANAFVLNNHIYFTTGLIKLINEEDTLKAIYLHEYGHVIKNHFQAKKVKIQQSNYKNKFYALFSVGLAAFSNNANLGIGSIITLNSSIVNEISRHSVNFEIEADNFMINQIIKNEISVLELISFLDNLDNKNNYFRTHPKNADRINNLNNLIYKKKENSEKFEWIKSKYSKNSKNKYFNIFFTNLEKGLFDKEKKIDKMNMELVHYEAFKKGFMLENWDVNFQNLLKYNKNSFLKIEYINFLLDNNIDDKYYIIDSFKFDEEIMNEYFYYFIYGKYYNKIGMDNLSNFYFCQFFKTINSINKSEFFCKKYDINNIPTLDKSYVLSK